MEKLENPVSNSQEKYQHGEHRPSHSLSGGDLRKSCVIAHLADVEVDLELESDREALLLVAIKETPLRLQERGSGHLKSASL